MIFPTIQQVKFLCFNKPRGCKSSVCLKYGNTSRVSIHREDTLDVSGENPHMYGENKETGRQNLRFQPRQTVLV